MATSHLLTALLLVAAVASSSGCPDASWTELDGICYWVSAWDVQVAGTWIEAACQNKHPDAKPVSIHSDKVTNFIAKMSEIGSTYIGLKRDAKGSNWVWSDGTTLDYINWDSLEPSTDQSCATVDHYDGTWSSEWCDASNSYACQIADQ